MTEVTKATPLEDSQKEQGRLFGIGPGAYDADTIRYDLPTESPEFQTPERPKRLEDLTAEVMIQIALSDRLAPDIYGHFSDKRADFIRLHLWTPYSEGEATRAIGGGLVNYLLGARNKGGMTAVRNVLNVVDKNRNSAVNAIDDIRLAQEDPDTGGFNPDWARANTHTRQALARAVLARNSLNLFEWPPHYDRRNKETRENRKTASILLGLADKLAGLDNESMVHLLQKTLVHQQERLSFWSKQVEKATEDDRTSDLISASKSRA